MKKFIKVIINADDLGKNHEVNDAIGKALTNKWITSSSIMANSDYWDEIVNIVNAHSEASFGVHLNMTEGRCLIDNPVLHQYGIIDENNLFTGNIRHFNSFPDDLSAAIFDEFDAQINNCIEKGVRITHLDGHHHVHTIQGLQEVLMQLVEKYQIKAVRNVYRKPLLFVLFNRKKRQTEAVIKDCNDKQEVVCIDKKMSWNHSHICVLSGKINNLAKGIIQRSAWRKKTKRHVFLTDYFDSYETAISNMSFGMKYPSGSNVELMCHPGHDSYSHELLLISQRAIEEYIKVEYISYKDI